MQESRRRGTLLFDFETMLHAAFENRVLPFDSGVARAYTGIAAVCRGADITPIDITMPVGLPFIVTLTGVLLAASSTEPNRFLASLVAIAFMRLSQTFQHGL